MGEKICFIAPSLPSGGAERVLSILANEFAKRDDCEVHFILFLEKLINFDLNPKIKIHSPKEKMERPKTGFSLPINKWLRRDLSYLVDEYLSKDALKWSGLFNEEFVTIEVQKFKKNKLHYTPIIWYLLTFQMWYKRWMISK